jgi:hypothetical protein
MFGQFMSHDMMLTHFGGEKAASEDLMFKAIVS